MMSPGSGATGTKRTGQGGLRHPLSPMVSGADRAGGFSGDHGRGVKFAADDVAGDVGQAQVVSARVAAQAVERLVQSEPAALGQHLWVPESGRMSRDRLIVVDEPAEAVAPSNLVDLGWRAAGEWS
jgi:hypothetical protein